MSTVVTAARPFFAQSDTKTLRNIPAKGEKKYFSASTYKEITFEDVKNILVGRNQH